jgi:hypothetical protein
MFRRGEKHHWWPKGLSKFWEDKKGLVNRIDASGKSIKSKAKEFGHISDAHNFVNKSSSWNFSIEHFFDEPDNKMPKVIEWLNEFKAPMDGDSENKDFYFMLENEDAMLDALRVCILSLAVRSPRYRESIANSIEHFRGDIGNKSEAKNIITLNINQKYKSLISSSKGKGRFVLLFSKDEFIYGDGFYSNLKISMQSVHNLKLVVPMTPSLAVIWSNPSVMQAGPVLSSIEADCNMVRMVNHSVQVYSKEYLFYRQQQPVLIDDFKNGTFKKYIYGLDPVEAMIDELIPDVGLNDFNFIKSIYSE